MKLVDILARELKEWPEGVVTAVQDLDGEVKFDNSHEMPCMNNSTDVWIRQGDQGDSFYPKELSEDCSYAIVIRTQWQAAVDALNTGEIAYSTENVSVNADYATHTSSPINAECKIVQPEWNGDGLPPAGSIVHCGTHNRDVEILKTPEFIDHANGQYVSGACLALDNHELFWGGKFSLIRTPEQIAAEERKRVIEEMVYGAAGCERDGHNTKAFLICGFLYDAGYRKPSTTDN